MRPIKNLKIRITIMALTLPLALSSCHRNYEVLDQSLEEVIYQQKEFTYLDEISQMKQTHLTLHKDETTIEILDLITASDKLADYLTLIDRLQELNIEDKAKQLYPLTQQEKQPLKDLTNSEIEMLIAACQQEEGFVEQVTSQQAIQKLGYLQQYSETWIDNHATTICEQLLQTVIQSLAARAAGFKASEYQNFYINNENSDEITLTYQDPNTNAKTDMVITDQNCLLYETAQTLHHLRYNQAPTYQTYQTCLNMAKLCICAGSTLEKCELSSQKSYHELIKTTNK